MKVPLIPVEVQPGLIVLHTKEELERFWNGVDREVCEIMAKPLDNDDEENSE